MNFATKRILQVIGILIGLWLGLQYLLPVLLPFLLGALLALTAEPVVKLLSRRLPRPFASGIGVTLTLVICICLLLALTAIAIRKLGQLVAMLPDLSQTAISSLTALQDFLTGLAQKTPAGLQPMLLSIINGVFGGSSDIVDEIARRIPGIATAILGQLPGSALAIGTWIFSAYMISARLPQLRNHISAGAENRYLHSGIRAVKKLKTALFGWLKAQLKLSCVCFILIAAGLLLLRIPYAIVWALVIAVVDAIPVLGTGTVLLPWAFVSLIQGQNPRALGLLGIYIVAVLSRSALEPRLLGKQLGLDPLITLLCLYAGYVFWGIGGILLSPLLSVAITETATLLRRPATDG